MVHFPLGFAVVCNLSFYSQYIIANLGFSLNFGGIDFENLGLPATMRVDWIRVYQPTDARNIGCDPPEYPTATYIETCVPILCPFHLTTDSYQKDIRKRIPTRT